MKKRRICVVTNNRSDYVGFKTVLTEFKKYKQIDVRLIVGGSHLLSEFGATMGYIKEDGFEIDATIKTVSSRTNLKSMAKSVGTGIQEYSTLFEKLKPDIILISGDRFDILAVAVSAAIMNIRIAHINGGEITGTIDESIRHAVTKLAHIHFTSTKESKKRVIKMGEDPENVHLVGSPSIDVLVQTKVKEGVSTKSYALCIQHPVTTEYEESYNQMKATLEAIYESKIRTILIYPNIDAGSSGMIQAIKDFDQKYPNMKKIINKRLQHINTEEYIRLLANCRFIIGNSSSGIRESCFFGVPAINIGTRQSGREQGGNVINVSNDKDDIKEAIRIALKKKRFPCMNLYGDGNAGKRIAKILATCKLPDIQKKMRY